MEPPAPHDTQAWLVFADWLQSGTDPHLCALGEAIVLGDAATALTEQHRDAWLGELATLHGVKLEDWHAGFPRELRLDAADAEPAKPLATVLDHLMSARLERVTVTTCYEDGGTVASIVELLARGRPRGLRDLSIANEPNYGSPWRTYPVHIGHAGGLWRYPLRSLVLEGAAGTELGTITAPQLGSLVAGVLGATAMQSLAAADLPALTTLRLDLGDAGAVALLPAVIDRFPRVRTLSLATHIIDTLLAVLPQCRALTWLDELCLGRVRIGDHHLDALARCRDACARIPRVRVNARSLTGATPIPRLGRALDVVRWRV